MSGGPRRPDYPGLILRRSHRFGARGVLVVLAFIAPLVAASPARAVAPLPPPKAWIAVDADTGNIIDAGNDHAALPPASLTKIITALAAVHALPGGPVDVPVSAEAAAAPAHKISMKQGEVWPLQDTLYSLLLSSANDAAVALAERAGGTLEGFKKIFTQTAADLGMADHPLLQDPAGLDGPDGVDGGNLVSARDLAIAARALLDDPRLAPIVATDVYKFVGPDGAHHRLLNHNWHFLQTYPGAIGMKTGYTDRAGPCLITAARRGGRTMLAVVLNAPNEYTFSVALLDKGFATPVDRESTADQLPPVPATPATPAAAGTASAPVRPADPPLTPLARRSLPARSGSLLSVVTDFAGGWPFWVAVLLVGGIGVLRLRVVLRRSARRRRRATIRQAGP